MQKKVWFKNERGERLVGTAHIHKTKEKLPAVILAHGFGSVRSERGMFIDIAKALFGAGFCVWRFDFVGCGESSGSFLDMTLTRETKELRDIIRFVKKQPKVDRNRIGLLGMSFGSCSTVALNPKVKAIVLLSSVAKPYQSLRELFGDEFNPKGISVYSYSSRYGKGKVKIGPKLWEDLKKCNLPRLIRKIKIPILIIHGEKDSLVLAKDHAKVYYNNANKPKKLVIIKSANHGYVGQPMRRQMVEEVTNWFKKYL